MKPNTRILDYVTLVQDGVLTLDDVPQDIKAQVTKWVRYLSGVEDDSMVKDNEGPEAIVPTPASAVDTKALTASIADQTKKVLNNDGSTIK